MEFIKKYIDRPQVNEHVKLTTGLTLNRYGPFYSGNIVFRDKIRKFKIPGVSFKHLHNLPSNLRIGYIVNRYTKCTTEKIEEISNDI